MYNLLGILILLFFVCFSGISVGAASGYDLTSTPESSTIHPLKIKARAFVFDQGRKIAELSPGDKVVGLFQAPFYRVKLANGKEGWIEAALLENSNADVMSQGYQAYQKRDYKKAISYFKKAVELKAKDFNAYFWLSASYLAEGNNDLAVSNINQALKLDPNNRQGKKYAESLASLYFGNGKKYLKNQHYMNAVLAFKRVLELKPSSKITQEKYVYARKMLGYNENQAVSKEKIMSPKIVKRYINKVENTRTYRGTSIRSALRSLLSLLKSSGTKVYVDGWRVRHKSTHYLVSYICRREVEGEAQIERFDWKVGRHIHSVTPVSNNARLLMRRW